MDILIKLKTIIKKVFVVMLLISCMIMTSCTDEFLNMENGDYYTPFMDYMEKEDKKTNNMKAIADNTVPDVPDNKPSEVLQNFEEKDAILFDQETSAFIFGPEYTTSRGSSPIYFELIDFIRTDTENYAIYAFEAELSETNLYDSVVAKINYADRTIKILYENKGHNKNEIGMFKVKKTSIFGSKYIYEIFDSYNFVLMDSEGVVIAQCDLTTPLSLLLDKYNIYCNNNSREDFLIELFSSNIIDFVIDKNGNVFLKMSCSKDYDTIIGDSSIDINAEIDDSANDEDIPDEVKSEYNSGGEFIISCYFVTKSELLLDVNQVEFYENNNTGNVISNQAEQTEQTEQTEPGDRRIKNVYTYTFMETQYEEVDNLIPDFVENNDDDDDANDNEDNEEEEYDLDTLLYNNYKEIQLESFNNDEYLLFATYEEETWHNDSIFNNCPHNLMCTVKWVNNIDILETDTIGYSVCESVINDGIDENDENNEEKITKLKFSLKFKSDDIEISSVVEDDGQVFYANDFDNIKIINYDIDVSNAYLQYSYWLDKELIANINMINKNELQFLQFNKSGQLWNDKLDLINLFKFTNAKIEVNYEEDKNENENNESDLLDASNITISTVSYLEKLKEYTDYSDLTDMSITTIDNHRYVVSSPTLGIIYYDATANLVYRLSFDIAKKAYFNSHNKKLCFFGLNTDIKESKTLDLNVSSYIEKDLDEYAIYENTISNYLQDSKNYVVSNLFDFNFSDEFASHFSSDNDLALDIINNLQVAVNDYKNDVKKLCLYLDDASLLEEMFYKFYDCEFDETVQIAFMDKYKETHVDYFKTLSTDIVNSTYRWQEEAFNKICEDDVDGISKKELIAKYTELVDDKNKFKKVLER